MNYEDIRIIVELQSLALTAPVLVLCAFVIYECLRPLKTSIKGSQMRWILFGICFGFAGNLIDNLYWALPWTADYLSLSSTPDLVKFGVFPNLLFRQTLTSVAAYCHLRAFIPEDNTIMLRLLNWGVVTSIVLGEGYILALWCINQGLF